MASVKSKNSFPQCRILLKPTSDSVTYLKPAKNFILDFFFLLQKVATVSQIFKQKNARF